MRVTILFNKREGFGFRVVRNNNNSWPIGNIGIGVGRRIVFLKQILSKGVILILKDDFRAENFWFSHIVIIVYHFWCYTF